MTGPARGAPTNTEIGWVVLTMGDRPIELAAAVSSLADESADVLVLCNGGDCGPSVDGARLVVSTTNEGVPGGRDRGVRETTAPVVGFLDDDARLATSGAARLIAELFAADPRLGAVAFRIVDETGSSTRRHVPRVGSRSVARGGPVVTFLGGACAIRRSAYEAVGGYWSDLFYAHEELELAWRLHDAGFDVVYDPRIEVVHPRMPISRHPDGWRLTGRNRVMIARRDLPWVVALVHVTTWLALGIARAPDGRCRRAYVSGWWSGWSHPVRRRAVRWRTVLKLARLGRPPVI